MSRYARPATQSSLCPGAHGAHQAHAGVGVGEEPHHSRGWLQLPVGVLQHLAGTKPPAVRLREREERQATLQRRLQPARQARMRLAPALRLPTECVNRMLPVRSGGLDARFADPASSLRARWHGKQRAAHMVTGRNGSESILVRDVGGSPTLTQAFNGFGIRAWTLGGAGCMTWRCGSKATLLRATSRRLG